MEEMQAQSGWDQTERATTLQAHRINNDSRGNIAREHVRRCAVASNALM